ncbi:enoyl-CoA hydratase/isomerase family protein [Nocardia miyunensis]|uniref:enoyl-CoA hydratase/isomerase family protein n=1 Tax=Nocardia miyunensis TaxID=282684 RepID=UPI000834EDB8|nr:enoyl-CoA hydratase/isomerase family protein [Nocardia miyunensis]
MTTPELVLEYPQDRVATIRINRPSVYNALHSKLIAEIASAVADLAADTMIGAIVITGTGEKAFSAGADLDELTGLDEQAATEILASGQACLRAIEQCGVPVIAAVNGLALGGGLELVLCCSFAVLSERASLGLPETGLGLIPGYGGTQRLTRVAGPAVARFAMLTGRRLSAEQAYLWGITPVPPVPADELIGRATEFAGDIAARGPRAAAAVLRLTGLAGDRPLDEMLIAETAAAAAAVGSDEGAEGIAAFTTKRAPMFGGAR